MDIRATVKHWLLDEPPRWTRDFDALDREYRAGRLTVEKYLFWKERILACQQSLALQRRIRFH